MGIRIFTALIFIALLSEMSYLLLRKKFPPLRPGQPVTEGNIQAVGSLLFKDYLIPFEVASLLLLVAMIGAIILSRKRA
ncbi:MAG: NADH-quinone oxidoreductase subunit J [Candidatus Aminicenantia bacterium]